MAREVEESLIDQEARARFGEIIGRAVREGGSAVAYGSRR
jgi:hypothetical protein